MDPVTLSPAQRQALQKAISKFKDYSATERYKADLQDRENRQRFFQQELPSRLEQISEADVEEIVDLLWAHRMWGNKAYVAQKLVEENGLERLRQNLRLLYSQEIDPVEAYDRFLSSVKRWGPASVTEMLAYIYPERCGIWNKQARTALEILGFADQIDVNKYRLSKQEYQHFNRLLQVIAEEMRQAGLHDVDLLVVDFLLYHVTTSQPEPPLPPDFDHDEIRDLIASIGQNLGFETQTEVQIARGARVDVVWRARIGNLGMVTYVFEVHRSGSIDSLILNLQRALNAPTVQKVIAVSDRNQLQRIESECADLPETFRRMLRLWDVADVVKAAEALELAMSHINKLGLPEPDRGLR
jgi:hypothetical protein